MILATVWQAIEASPVGSFVAASAWAFPTLESAHVIAIVTVVGSIAMMDLRLLGLASKDSAVTAVSRDTLPLTWIAFVFAAITGVLLFTSKATGYVANPYFVIKMGLLVLAGLNMAWFHAFAWRGVAAWDTGVTPLVAKLAGGFSLTLWVLIVFFGRAIGFTLGIYDGGS
jgi:hypothetical protein